jgi:hypothetical protein
MNQKLAEVIDHIADVVGHVVKIMPVLEDVQETLG